MKYYGYKLHTVVTLTGTILDFMLSSATPHDSQAVEELLGIQESLKEVFGDKAYWIPEIMVALKEQRGLILLACKKNNQVQTESEKKQGKALNRLRLMVETINAQLQEQFHLSKHYAKSTWGLFTRIAAKITAHTLGMYMNILFGRSKLSLASLAV